MNVCNSTDLPELEIISLLEEQLPVYRLRADTIFGYDHDDWLHTPLVSHDSPALDLTTEQIEETLKYFLLCADRVGQMTKTYSDIDAVTRLLEEKERDLELAARIGQSLLKKNKTLSERNELLEEQVERIREEVSQLRHDLSMKDDLLQFYTSAAEESEGESATSTPIRPSDAGVSMPTYFPLDSLQRKLKDLEEENLSLRSEASHLETETICYEEKEQQLVNDCVKELRDANLQMSSLAEELARKTEDASRQQEEITHLLSQIVDLQKKTKSYAVENEELTLHLGAAKDAQRQLTAELRELEDKYAECMEMLHEAQEELKNLRNKSVPQGTNRRFHSLGLFPMDSLAAEIEGTMRKELQMDDPEVEEQKLHPKRVFQTVRNLNLMRQQRSSLSPSPLNIPGSNQTSCLTSGRSSRVGTPHCNSMYGSETGSSCILDNKTASPDDGSGDSNRRPPGTPGTPGGRDLEAALRRLSLRRDNYLSERRFFEEERERKLAYLAKEEEAGGGDSVDCPGTPAESLLSLCTHPSLGSVWSGYSFSVRSYLPEKLQIVKPLEGSATLHAWQQLAQPHLGRLLDHRPGVVTKGFRSLEHEQEQEGAAWHLDQPEEDDESPAPFTGSLSSLPCSSTPNPFPSVRHRAVDPVMDPLVDPLPCLWRGPTLMNGSLRGKDGVVPSPSPPPLPPALNGQADATELQASVVDSVPVNFPGKCMSHTSATYTFTTCRILHPSDQLTSVSSSPAMSSCQSSSTFFGSSPIPASSPARATPPYTPRRLSLSRAESSTNARDPTRTTSTSLGLVRLLLEQGISSSVYDPRSWDRATPPSPGWGGDGRAAAVDAETGAAAHHRHFLPATPPNSPTGCAPSKTPPSPTFLLSPSCDEPPFYETFLASRPARSILREILGESDQGQAEVSNLRLLDKLKRFRARPPSLLPAPGALLGLGGGSSTLGGGLRRNRSYPAMVGASMAMKDPGGPPSTQILSPPQHTVPHTPPCHSGGACQSARSRPPRQTRLHM